MVRLNADGTLDNTFGTNGKFLLDIDQKNGSARAAVILADGSIIGTGYASTPSVGDTTQVVLYKLTPAGVLDTTFGVNGIFHDIVLSAATEAYGAVVEEGKLVTLGYGRQTTSESLDFVSLRFSGTGVLDKTWGNNGATRVDAAGFNDNGRFIAALPGGKVLLVGGGRSTSANADGMLAVLDGTGTLDTTILPTGKKLYDLGGTADFFWGAAVSPDQSKVVVVGLKGVDAAKASGDNNDDAAVLALPLK
jgi:uncharacterized delta-60 repeat protein